MFSSSYSSDKPYIPRSVSEIWDFLGAMMLSAPTFKDKTGYFPDRNVDTEFFALIRKKVGEENYQALVALSDKMRAHFEAEPEDKTEDGIKGRDCIIEMEEILKASARHKSR